MKWNNIQTKTELEYILSDLLSEYDNLIVTKVFCLEGTSFDANEKNIIYSVDDSIYIKFSNDYCLIITLLFESVIDVEYRKMTTKEEILYEKSIESDKDLFNTKHDIYNWERKPNGEILGVSVEKNTEIEINVEYSKIKNIEVRGFNHEYLKWINKVKGCEIITMPQGGDYFDELRIILDNDIKICICPMSAEDDGYCDLWCEEKSTKIKYKCIKLNGRE